MVRFVAIPCHPFPPILPQPEVIVLGAALLIGILMTGAGTWLVHPTSWTSVECRSAPIRGVAYTFLYHVSICKYLKHRG